ncbi:MULTISPECIES: hypothetical protein [unclassified Methylibium]|uniref:hypothetical protein n=1 Tax=unclassified Methylibium TaxID=2633235 RepID=UPI0003F43325|nr:MULTISPECIES: hypothetical protein [unclassified Methylibium]EWS55730.1 hypothetical protein X551_01476 [Methylibium sp. T29]EWS59728.1 hypothetical protein Y694_02436 [Methylibium sp. T29-B]
MKGLVAVELTQVQRYMLASFVEMIGTYLVDSGVARQGPDPASKFVSLFSTPLSNGNSPLWRSLGRGSRATCRGGATSVMLRREQAAWWCRALFDWMTSLSPEQIATVPAKYRLEFLRDLGRTCVQLARAADSRRGKRRKFNASKALDEYERLKALPRSSRGRPLEAVALKHKVSVAAMSRALKQERRRREIPSAARLLLG